MKKLTALLLLLIMTSSANMQNRPRARELGVVVGILPTGTLNAITDVDGVLIGHTTIVRGDNIRTGVTAILPHGGNLFREKVPGAVFVGNGFGKLAGSTQVNELGEIETPILLTSTLSVPRVADFLLDYMLSLPGNEDVSTTFAGATSREMTLSPRSKVQKAALSRKVAWGPEPAPSLLASRAALARRLESCRSASAVLRWAFWSKPTSVEF
jgi:hypothetical protein